MQERKFRGLGVAIALAMVVVSGCAIEVTLTGPSTAGSGTPVQMDLGLRNASQCPVGEIEAIVFAFIPEDEIEIESDDEGLEELLRELFSALCRGTSFELPDGFVCRVEGEGIICEDDTALSTPGGGSATVSTPRGTILTCQRSAGSVQCQGPALLTGANTVSAAQTILCAQLGDTAFCGVDVLAPGQSIGEQLTFTAPTEPGTYFSLAFGGSFAGGVCMDGSNVGQACSDDTDCPAGTADNCGSGICVDDVTEATGAGCNVDGDCDTGESCVACQTTDLDGLFLPIACFETQVASLTAPATSSWTLVGSVLAILALGFFGLRWRSGFAA
jgi:hypothetical protein